MTNSAGVTTTVRKLVTEKGPRFIDDQLRRHLFKIGAIGENDSLAALMIRGRGIESAEEGFDFSKIMWWFEHPHFYSHPVPQPAGYTGPNSPVAGAWHFKQSNGWDSWFNFVVRADGGFYVLAPTSRTTGSQDAGIQGNESVAACFDASESGTTYPMFCNSFNFVVRWDNGSEGQYQCFGDDYGTSMTGIVTDRDSQDQARFTASKMGPATKISPGGWPVSHPELRVPAIEVTWVIHPTGWLYDEVVKGSGFIPYDEVLIFANGNYFQTGQLGSVKADHAGEFVYRRDNRRLHWSPLTYLAFGEISGYTKTVEIDSTPAYSNK